MTPLLLALAFLAVVTLALVCLHLMREGWRGYSARFLVQADRELEAARLTVAPRELLIFSALLALLVGLMCFLVTAQPVLGLAVGALAFVAPRGFLALLLRRRAKQFRDQLPDALATINNALRAGAGLPRAFEVVQAEATGPMRQELGILLQELRLGLSLEQALQNLCRRMSGEEVVLLATATAVAHEVGGSITEVYEKIEHTIRERQRLEGRIETLTSQGRMQGWIVGALPILMGGLLWFIDPELMRPLFTTGAGWAMLGAIVVLEFLGFLTIRQIVAIEV